MSSASSASSLAKPPPPPATFQRAQPTAAAINQPRDSSNLESSKKPHKIVGNATTGNFVLRINPTQIVICGNLLGRVQHIMQLKNKSGDRLAFKIRCTSNELFRIRPSCGIIEEKIVPIIITYTCMDKGLPGSRHHLTIYHIPAPHGSTADGAWQEHYGEPQGKCRFPIRFLHKSDEENASNNNNSSNMSSPSSAAPLIQFQALGFVCTLLDVRTRIMGIKKDHHRCRRKHSRMPMEEENGFRDNSKRSKFLSNYLVLEQRLQEQRRNRKRRSNKNSSDNNFGIAYEGGTRPRRRDLLVDVDEDEKLAFASSDSSYSNLGNDKNSITCCEHGLPCELGDCSSDEFDKGSTNKSERGSSTTTSSDGGARHRGEWRESDGSDYISPSSDEFEKVDTNKVERIRSPVGARYRGEWRDSDGSVDSSLSSMSSLSISHTLPHTGNDDDDDSAAVGYENLSDLNSGSSGGSGRGSIATSPLNRIGGSKGGSIGGSPEESFRSKRSKTSKAKQIAAAKRRENDLAYSVIDQFSDSDDRSFTKSSCTDDVDLKRDSVPAEYLPESSRKPTRESLVALCAADGNRYIRSLAHRLAKKHERRNNRAAANSNESASVNSSEAAFGYEPINVDIEVEPPVAAPSPPPSHYSESRMEDNSPYNQISSFEEDNRDYKKLHETFGKNRRDKRAEKEHEWWHKQQKSGKKVSGGGGFRGSEFRGNDSVNLYIGEVTRQNAEAMCPRLASFRLYHRIPSNCKNIVQELPLTIVYNTSKGNYCHYRILHKKSKNGVNQVMVNIVDEPAFPSLKSLVAFYSTYVLMSKSDQNLVDSQRKANSQKEGDRHDDSSSDREGGEGENGSRSNDGAIADCFPWWRGSNVGVELNEHDLPSPKTSVRSSSYLHRQNERNFELRKQMAELAMNREYNRTHNRTAKHNNNNNGQL